MTVAFASVRRWNPTLELTLVTTERPLEPFAAQLGELGVGIEIAPFNFAPPENYAPTFNASLYMLDAISACSKSTLFIDPDVFCVGSLEQVFESTRDRWGVLPISTPPDENINGLTLEQCQSIYRDFGVQTAPVHVGGELFHVPAGDNRAFRQIVDEAWRYSLDAFSRCELKFVTEEHFLAFATANIETVSLEWACQRIWTAHRYRKIPANYQQLLLWHLPAEKDRGFAQLYPAVARRDDWFWNADAAEFRDIAAREFGLANRRIGRSIADGLGVMANRLTAH